MPGISRAQLHPPPTIFIAVTAPPSLYKEARA
jgi:hypothetical protein